MGDWTCLSQYDTSKPGRKQEMCVLRPSDGGVTVEMICEQRTGFSVETLRVRHTARMQHAVVNSGRRAQWTR